MKYSSVIFDWDGTLAQTLHLWDAGYRFELERLGVIVPDGTTTSDLLYEHDKMRELYPSINFDTYFPNVYDYVYEHVSELETYPGAAEALTRLERSGRALAIVSSSTRKLLQKGLHGTGLAHFFTATVSGDDVMRHKPHPEPFETALAVAHMDKATVLILGDSHADIVAAKAAGLDSCIFLPPQNAIYYDFEKLRQENPTHCVTTLEEFVDLVVGSDTTNS